MKILENFQPDKEFCSNIECPRHQAMRNMVSHLGCWNHAICRDWYNEVKELTKE